MSVPASRSLTTVVQLSDSNELAIVVLLPPIMYRQVSHLLKEQFVVVMLDPVTAVSCFKNATQLNCVRSLLLVAMH